MVNDGYAFSFSRWNFSKARSATPTPAASSKSPRHHVRRARHDRRDLGGGGGQGLYKGRMGHITGILRGLVYIYI